jgi:hypothetical protein
MDCIPRVIKLPEEFVDDEVDVDTSRFPQLTSISHEKMYYLPRLPRSSVAHAIPLMVSTRMSLASPRRACDQAHGLRGISR